MPIILQYASGSVEMPLVVRVQACKGERELKGMVEAHEEDGVALATFFCWFEKQLLANARAAATQQQEPLPGEGECILTEFTLKEAVDAAREATVSCAQSPYIKLPLAQVAELAAEAPARADTTAAPRGGGSSELPSLPSQSMSPIKEEV